MQPQVFLTLQRTDADSDVVLVTLCDDNDSRSHYVVVTRDFVEQLLTGTRKFIKRTIALDGEAVMFSGETLSGAGGRDYRKLKVEVNHPSGGGKIASYSIGGQDASNLAPVILDGFDELSEGQFRVASGVQRLLVTADRPNNSLRLTCTKAGHRRMESELVAGGQELAITDTIIGCSVQGNQLRLRCAFASDIDFLVDRFMCSGEGVFCGNDV
jgi:hypothetical protein